MAVFFHALNKKKDWPHFLQVICEPPDTPLLSCEHEAADMYLAHFRLALIEISDA